MVVMCSCVHHLVWCMSAATQYSLSCTHSLTHLINSLTWSFTHLINSLTWSLTHLINSLTWSLTHLITHSLTLIPSESNTMTFGIWASHITYTKPTSLDLQCTHIIDCMLHLEHVMSDHSPNWAWKNFPFCFACWSCGMWPLKNLIKRKSLTHKGKWRGLWLV